MFHVQHAVLRRARERKRDFKKRRQLTELSELERQPSNLLGDKDLIHQTHLDTVEKDLDQRGRLRHDYCVLFRQVGAFDTTGCVSDSLGAVEKSLPAMLKDSRDQQKASAARKGESSKYCEVSSAFHEEKMLVGSQVMEKPMQQEASSRHSRLVTGMKSLKNSIVGDAVWLRRHVHKRLPSVAWQLHVIYRDGTTEKRALCCLQETHSIRKFCLWFIKLPWFEPFILMMILANCVMMAVDQADSSANFRRAFAIGQEAFLYIFSLEILLKVVAMGLMCGRHTYLRDHWNKLDVLIVWTDWFVVITNQFQSCQVHGLFLCSEVAGNPTNLSVLRTIRILRPFRSINRFNHMKFLVLRLIQALPELLDSAVMLGFCQLLFSIVSVQLYSGTFLQRCVDPITGQLQPETLDGGPTSNLCRLGSRPGDTWGSCKAGFVCREGVGSNPNLGVTSFDNMAAASLTIFQAITLEGWSSVMYDVRQAKGLGNDLFFIVLVVFGALFMMNLVVAVLVSNFDGEEEEDARIGDQKIPLKDLVPRSPSDEHEEITILSPTTLTRAAGSLRKCCLKIISSKTLDNTILLLILLNTAALALDNLVDDAILDAVNAFFTSVFTLEMIMKVVGLGPRAYCSDAYNQFDGIIVIISVADLCILLSVGTDVSGDFMVIRAFRLMRVFKLSRRLQSLQKVLNALRESLVHIRDLGFLLLLFMFVCALMGMSFFSSKDEDGNKLSRWSIDQSGYYQGKIVRPNFSTIGNALLTIFIIVTGENWNDVMYVGVHNTGWPCTIFFVLVVVIGHYLILNLFLAILVDSFEKKDVDAVPINTDSADSDASWLDQRISRLRRPTKTKHKVSQADIHPGSITLHLFSSTNPVRLYLVNLVAHPHFESLTYLLIAVSSVVLALDSPDEEDLDRQNLFGVMDAMLTGFFTLEALLKIVAWGFVMHTGSYLRDAWNVLDFFIVLTSIGNLVMRESGFGNDFAWVKALRALRALRPLRMVSRNEGLKAVTMSILAAIPPISEVLLVLLLFLMIFSVLGVQFFKNKFNRCSCMDWCPLKRYNPLSSLAAEKPSDQLCQGQCLEAPAHERNCSWEHHPHYSFDNTFYALLTLFEVSTLEMWPEVMWLAVDGVGEDEAPEYNHNPIVVFFFIVFISVMTFFILNLFVGVVIDKFTMVRNELNGLLVMTERQQLWVKTQKKLLKVTPKPLLTPPDDKWRQLALQLIDSPVFEETIAGIIMANVAMMCTSFYAAPRSVDRLQENANVVFLGIYTLEAVAKLYALHFKLYFRDPWNVFDFFVVFISLATSSSSVASYVQIETSLFRTARVVRMFRLIKSLKTLRILFQTLVLSLPALLNIGLMLLLLFYVYTIAGMSLFGDIEVINNPYQTYLNKDVNFRNFYLTMVTMLRMSTGESWNGIMHDCFSGALCANKPNDFSCGSTPISVIFFVSFMLIGAFVFLNLFIAVLIQNLFESEWSKDSNETIRVTDDDLARFVEAWSRLAPDGGKYIETRKLKRLLMDIEAPLGFSGEILAGQFLLRVIDRLGFRDYDGHIHFAETLWRLASTVDGADMSGEVADFEVQRNLNRKILRMLPVPPREKARCGMMLYKASEVLAALEVQSRWKARKARKAFRESMVDDHGEDQAERKTQQGMSVLAAFGGQRSLAPSARRSVERDCDHDQIDFFELATVGGSELPVSSPIATSAKTAAAQSASVQDLAPSQVIGSRVSRTSSEIVPALDGPSDGISCVQCFSACHCEASVKVRPLVAVSRPESYSLEDVSPGQETSLPRLKFQV